MNDQITEILSQWVGEDAAGQRSPREVAGDIDRAYREYLASLPGTTEAVLAGQRAMEQRASRDQ